MTTQGISVWTFRIVDAMLRGCSNSSPEERCIYPDQYNGTFNASLTYACPTVLSFPHFYKVNHHSNVGM